MSAAHTAAHAQPSATYAVTSGHAREREAFDARARAWLEEHGETARPLAAPVGERSDGAPLRELAVLDATELALLDARERAARFDEAGALRVLGAAEQSLRAHLAVPGAHAFLAEVYLQMALAAASLGYEGLAETLLTHASTLDARRSLQAAEAPPSVLALARRIERARDTAGRSRTHISADPQAALLWLDGVALGAAPRDVEVSPGLHLLVVRRAGHAPYASLVELGAGSRMPVHVVLSPEPAEEARLALVRSLANRASAEAQARRLAASTGAPVWLFALAPGRSAEVVRCMPDACSVTGTLPASDRAAHAATSRTGGEARPGTTRPLWRRWPVWVAASATIVAGVALAAWMARDEHTRTARELELDPGMPPD